MTPEHAESVLPVPGRERPQTRKGAGEHSGTPLVDLSRRRRPPKEVGQDFAATAAPRRRRASGAETDTLAQNHVVRTTVRRAVPEHQVLALQSARAAAARTRSLLFRAN